MQVVIPSSQKSWIGSSSTPFRSTFDIYLTTGNLNVGKAFHIRDTIKGRYFYPREPGMSNTDLRMVEKCDTLRSPLVPLFRVTVQLLRSMVSIEPLTLITSSPDGQGEISNKSRPLKPGEVGEWILLDGVCPTPRVSHPSL